MVTDIKPRISIIMAVLNRAHCVERAIEGVLNQSYENVELVVIDGGSTDGTVDILKKYDHRINYWTSEPDNGIYDALNKGIKVATGSWINIQGSDDLLYDSIDDIAPYLVSERTVYYGDLFYRYQKKVRFGRMNAYQLANYRFGHHRFFFPRNFFSNYSYNTKYTVCADYEMLVRSFCEGQYAFQYLPVVVAEYNERDGASSHLIDHEFNRERFKFMRSHFPLMFVLMFYLRKNIAHIRKKIMH